jgi:hypothetical protein
MIISVRNISTVGIRHYSKNIVSKKYRYHFEGPPSSPLWSPAQSRAVGDDGEGRKGRKKEREEGREGGREKEGMRKWGQERNKEGGKEGRKGRGKAGRREGGKE